MPSGVEFNTRVTCNEDPISIGCHLSGDMAFTDEKSQQIDYYNDETLFIARASPQYYAVKTSSSRLKAFGIFFFPGAEKLIFENSPSIIKDRYLSLFNEQNCYFMDKFKIPPLFIYYFIHGAVIYYRHAVERLLRH